jgi:hypothetical protein
VHRPDARARQHRHLAAVEDWSDAGHILVTYWSHTSNAGQMWSKPVQRRAEHGRVHRPDARARQHRHLAS